MASRNQAIEKYNAGKYQTALNIAKNFKMGVTDEQRAQMALGYECKAHADTYAQMGYDCEAEVKKAMDILMDVLGINNTDKKEDTMAEDTIQEVAEEEVAEAAVTEEEEELCWLYISSKRDKKIYAEITYEEDIDNFVKCRRAEGYHFVALISRPKLMNFLDGNQKGMKGVFANLAKKGVDNVEQFLSLTSKQAEIAYDVDKLINAVEVL